MEQHESAFGQRRGLFGLRSAQDRLCSPPDGEMPDAMACAATEAAMWACALDDLLGQKGRPGAEAYLVARAADVDAAVLPGLRWARNAGIHLLIAPHRYTAGATFPLSFPARFDGITWLARQELPEIRKNPRLEAAYHEHLEGQDARDTIIATCRWFDRQPVSALI